MICYFICKFRFYGGGKYAKQIDQLLSTKYTNLNYYSLMFYGGIGRKEIIKKQFSR